MTSETEMRVPSPTDQRLRELYDAIPPDVLGHLALRGSTPEVRRKALKHPQCPPEARALVALAALEAPAWPTIVKDAEEAVRDPAWKLVGQRVYELRLLGVEVRE